MCCNTLSQPMPHVCVDVEQVTDGKVDALVLDEPWLRYQTNQRCELRMVGRTFQYVNNAVGFNVNLPAAFTHEYDLVLLKLLEDGVYETLERTYIEESNCPTLEISTQITLEQMSGLWVVFCSLLGFSILLMLLPRIFPKMDVEVGRFTRSMSSFGSLAMTRAVSFARSSSKMGSSKTNDLAMAASNLEEYTDMEEGEQRADKSHTEDSAQQADTFITPNSGGQKAQDDVDEIPRVVQSW